MRALHFLLLPALICQLCAHTQAAEPIELKSLRLEFQSKLVEINTPLTEFNAKYRGYLEKQKSEYQQQGNLEAMLGVEEELERFDSALPDGDETVSTFRELKRLQEIYRKQLTARKKQLSPQRLALIAD